MRSNPILRFTCCATLAIVCAMLTGLSPTAHALPPRPTPAPAPEAGDEGASIELRVQFTPAQAGQWQTVWSVVQWQDQLGAWHDVEGWRGTLDDLADLEGQKTSWVGQKTWWVYQRDLGKGPFRWLVYEQRGGQLLVASQPFGLPVCSGQSVKTQVRFEP